MYQSYARGVETPAVWKWYVAYCIAMACLYVLTTIFGVVLLAVAPDALHMQPMESKIQGGACVVLGPILLIVFLIGIFLPRRPWAWIYGIVLICLGMTSCCCLPASIPLIIYWVKPETKAFFGRT
jgi:hypothetical protein